MITILGNVGNAGYALPMTQAYPLDVNSQYFLAWNPLQQALDYVPYVGNALGDFGVTRDLSVGRNVAVTGNAAIGGDLAVAGTATFAVPPVLTGGLNGPLTVTGALTTTGALQGTQVSSVAGANTALLSPTALNFQGTQVVNGRKLGWAAATGTATRTTFVTGSVTLPQLAERVKALLDDLTIHGLIGP